MNISQRIERLPVTPFLNKVLFVTGIGWTFDAMVTGMVPNVLAAIDKEWQLSKEQKGLFSSIGMLGMAFGAALSGMLADRFGRRKVMAGTIFLFGLASLLSGFSTNFTMLVVLRFLTGMGLGGFLPTASTVISEYAPTKVRGRYGVLLESFWAWGWILAALVGYLLIPRYGWRIALYTTAIPMLVSFVLYRYIPESPRYLAQKGFIDEADAILDEMEIEAGLEPVVHKTADEVMTRKKVSLTDLWNRQFRISTIVLWVIWFGINFGYYGFVLWTPSLLIDKGFDLVKSFGFTLIMCLAQLPGYYSSAYLVEKIGRKKVLSIYFFGTAVAAWLFGHAGSEMTIIIYGCLLYFFALGAWGCVYAYTPEVYPTEVRGSGVGWAAAFGRLGAFSAPFVVPVVYRAFGAEKGFTYVFILLMAVFFLVSVVVTLIGKETMGKTLEEINQ